MIFVTGPMFSGKKEYICKLFGWTDREFDQHGICRAEELAAKTGDLVSLAEELTKKEVVIASETGAGVVPVDKEARAAREKAGRLACMLAERADTVIRVCCGIPQCLKGELPERKTAL